MTNISNTADILDVRDIIERFEELEGESVALTEAHVEARATLEEKESELAESDNPGAILFHQIEACKEALSEAEEAENAWDDAEEFKALTDLLDDLKGGGGGDEHWRGAWYPVTLVRDSYFEEFAQDEAESLGAIDPKATWPLNCIDWEQAARELQIDYTSIEYDGVTYWYR